MTIRNDITACMGRFNRPVSALELLLQLSRSHTDAEVRCALAALTRDGTIRKVKRYSYEVRQGARGRTSTSSFA
jgi:hypothetical protein